MNLPRLNFLFESPPINDRTYEHPNLLQTIFASSSLMTAIDVFIVNVALHQMGQDVGQDSLNDLTWVLNAYTIIFAALLVPAGRIGDHIGNKKVFISGLWLFALASLGCALSSTLWLIVAFRVIQAVGAAAIVPTSLGLILTTLAPEKRRQAIRIWTLLGSIGAAAGPALGGLLVALSWRWIFVINVPIGIVAAIAASYAIPDVRHDSKTSIPDFVGGALLILSVGALALGLVQAPDWGWGSSGTILSLIISVISFGLFVLRSRKVEAPVVDFHLFKDRTFARANMPILFIGGSFGMQLLGLILVMQEGWGWSALKTGMAIAPGPAMVSIAGLFIRPYLAKRYRDGVVAAIGIFVQLVGGVLIGLSIHQHSNYALDVLLGWILLGAGTGIWTATLFSAGSANLPPHQSSTGSAVLQMGRWIGNTIGVALLVVILGSASKVGSFSRFKDLWLWAAISAAAAIVAALALPKKSDGENVSALAESEEVGRAIHG